MEAAKEVPRRSKTLVSNAKRGDRNVKNKQNKMYNKIKKHHVKQTENKTMYNLPKHNNIKIASSTCNTSNKQKFKNSDLSAPKSRGVIWESSNLKLKKLRTRQKAEQMQAPVKATERRLRLRQSDDSKMSKFSKVGQKLTSGILTPLSAQRGTELAEVSVIKCPEMVAWLTTTTTPVFCQPTGTACIISSDATTARTSMPAMQRAGPDEERCLTEFLSPGSDSSGTSWMCRVKPTRAIPTVLFLLYPCTQVCAVTPTISIPTSLIEIEGAANSNCIVPVADLTQRPSALGSCATAARLQAPVKTTERRLRLRQRQSDDSKVSKFSKVGQKLTSGILTPLSAQSCIGRMRISFVDSTAPDSQAMAPSLIYECVCGVVCCSVSSSLYCYSP